MAPCSAGVVATRVVQQYLTMHAETACRQPHPACHAHHARVHTTRKLCTSRPLPRRMCCKTVNGQNSSVQKLMATLSRNAHAATYTVLLLHTCNLTATPTQELCMPPIHATARYHHLNCEAVAPRVRTQCVVVVNGRKAAAGMVKIVLVVLASGGLL